MSWVTWVVIGVLAYWLLAMTLDRRGILPEWVHVSGPLTTLHTQRGKELLDRLAQRRRFWRAWANAGVGVALVVMVTSFLFVVLSAILSVQNPQTSQVTEPRNVVVVPGLNDFLPVDIAPELLLGLLVGLVVHEAGHGLLCRVEDIEIDSMGLALLTVIPLGAFVEPDRESQEAADRGGKTRMFAAGVTNNFAITVLAFLLLFGPVAGSIGVAGGAHVGAALSGSPADDAGIGGGDRITALENQSVDSEAEFQSALANVSAPAVGLEVDGERRVTVERAVFVTSAVAGTEIEEGDEITAVDGEPVRTVADFRDAVDGAGETPTLTVRSGGESVELTTPIGARVTLAEDGPFAATEATGGETLVITAFGDQRVRDVDELVEAIEARAPGDTVTVAAHADGERRTYEVTLGGSDGDPYLGIFPYQGVNGLLLDDLGAQYFPSERYLALLGGEGDAGPYDRIADSAVGRTLFTVMLPVAGIVDGQGLPANFPGFTGDLANFYVVDGPLAFLGAGLFVLANALFWIGWVNLNLGFFNCIPAFPLDGGHMLRTSAESVVSRLPVEADFALTKVITVSVGLAMGLGFVLMIFGPRYLF